MLPNIKTVSLPSSGWCIIDKPLHYSSRKAVNVLKRVLNIKKIGHAGTLDPLASGILPIAFGEATKTIPYIVAKEKEYVFSITWGEKRTTDDAEGDIEKTSYIRPTREAIQSEIINFTGHIEQTPPKYSAIKVNGQRAYQLARKGEEIILKSRVVDIKKFELQTIEADKAEFYVCCSPGTYIRSLARDLAEKLGTYGYVSALRRTSVGHFSEKIAFSLENFKKNNNIEELLDYILPVDEALRGLPQITVNKFQADQLKQGQVIQGEFPVFINNKKFDIEDLSEHNNIMYAQYESKLIAIIQSNHLTKIYKPIRVFNL